MPTLNVRVETKDQQGRTIAAPTGLAQGGPLVPVTLMISDAHRKILGEEGKPVPAVVNGTALIDTGASSTCIDQQAAERAGLPVIDKAMMASASHAKHEVPVYSAKLVIPDFSAIDVEYAMGASLDEMNLIALIGRDLLQGAVLVYNGTDGSIALSI